MSSALRFPDAEPDASESEVVAGLEDERAELVTELRETQAKVDAWHEAAMQYRTELIRLGYDPDAARCRNCGTPIYAYHPTQDYRGETMHALCALRLTVADLEGR